MSRMQSSFDTPESNRIRQINLNRYRNIRLIQHPGYIDRQKLVEILGFYH